MATEKDFQKVTEGQEIVISIRNGNPIHVYFRRIHPSGNSLCWTNNPNKGGEYREQLSEIELIKY